MSIEVQASGWSLLAEARANAAAAQADVVDERHFVSWETYAFMKREIRRLQTEVARLTADRDHWYMKANYSELELAIFARRRSLGQDEITGEWLTNEEQDAQRAQDAAHAA